MVMHNVDMCLVLQCSRVSGRARNFAFPPDKATMTTFQRYGFTNWLTRVKQLASVTATLTQLSEFVAWWQHTRKEK